MAAPQDIENAFCARVLATGLVMEALPYDPPRAPSRTPFLTMMFTQVTPSLNTGLGVVELNWRWTIYLVLQLKDWQRAQTDLKTVLPPLVTLITPASAPQLRTLDGSCDEAHLADEGDEPDFQPADEQLVKRLVLTAITSP